MTSIAQRTGSPTFKAVAGLLAVYWPIAAALLAGLELMPAIGFVIAAWATEWLVAYAFVGAGSPPERDERSSQRTRPAALGAPSATNE